MEGRRREERRGERSFFGTVIGRRRRSRRWMAGRLQS